MAVDDQGKEFVDQNENVESTVYMQSEPLPRDQVSAHTIDYY
jgi:hypothetical protein